MEGAWFTPLAGAKATARHKGTEILQPSPPPQNITAQEAGEGVRDFVTWPRQRRARGWGLGLALRQTLDERLSLLCKPHFPQYHLQDLPGRAS